MNACEAVISAASWRSGSTLPLVWLLFERNYFQFGIERFEISSAFFVLMEKALSSQTLPPPKSFLKAAAACLTETDAAVILLH